MRMTFTGDNRACGNNDPHASHLNGNNYPISGSFYGETFCPGKSGQMEDGSMVKSTLYIGDEYTPSRVVCEIY